MKVLSVLLIVGCVGVYAIEPIAVECFKQFGVNYDELMEKKLTEKQTLEEITPYRLGCIAACYLTKTCVHEMPMNKYIIDSLNKAQTKFSKAELGEIKEMANKCIIAAKRDECRLLECLSPWDSPIGSIIHP